MLTKRSPNINQKTQKKGAFGGLISKRSRSGLIWNSRFAQIDDGKLTYYATEAAVAKGKVSVILIEKWKCEEVCSGCCACMKSTWKSELTCAAFVQMKGQV